MPPALAKQRARNDEDKLVRREQLVRAAARVLERDTFAGMSMARVAREARLGKGTLYLYFRSKEELGLAVFERALGALFEDLGSELARRGFGDAEQFAAAVVACLERHATFTSLATVLHTLLERNIDLDTAVRFKQQLAAHLTAAGAVAESCLPFLRAGDGARLFVRAHALLIGVHQLANPTPIMAQAHARPGLEMFHVDFASELCVSLVYLLRGMEREAKEETER